MSAPLLELWSRVGPIIARDFDNLLEVLQIIGGYMLLGRGAFMSLHARDVVSVLDGCLMEVKDRGKVAVADCAALLLEVFPAEGPALLEPLVVRMLQVLLANRELGDTVVTAFTLVCGRALSLNPQKFWACVGGLCAAGTQPVAEVLGRLLDVWLPPDKTGRGVSFAAPSAPLLRRKLHTSAALALLGGPPPELGAGPSEVAMLALPRLGLAVRGVASVVGAEASAEGGSSDGVGDNALDGASFRDCDAERRRALFAADPTHTLDLRGQLEQLLATLGAAVGGAVLQQSLEEQVGPAILEALKR